MARPVPLYDITELHGVTTASTAIAVDADSQPIACVSFMVATTGNYTLANPTGANASAATIVLTLTANVMYYISTKVALAAAAGTVVYFY